jgi:hypothetical protein
MLICIVQIPEHRKKRRQMGMTPVIRLDQFDLSFRLATQRFDAIEWPPAKLSLGVRDRELELPFVWRRILTAFVDGKCINKMIERTTEGMNAVSADQRPAVQRWGVFDMDKNTMAASVTVLLPARREWFSGHPREKFALESSEVFVGALHLQPTAGKLGS